MGRGKRRIFTIKIEDGKAILETGKATRAFLHECMEIASRERIRNGEIRGIEKEGMRTVAFRDIPESSQ